jgi:hypothetical protein
MGFSFNFSWGNNNVQEPVSVEKDRQGNWFYWMFGGRGINHKKLTAQEKLNTILSNPACLKVFALNSDLFSMGKINTENQVEYLQTLRKRPNYKQTWTQFKFDCMTGTAYLYKSGGRLLENGNTLQWLNPAKLDFKPSTVQKMADFIFTKSTYKDLTSDRVRYNIGNGNVKYIPLDEITPMHDLSSGMNENFYEGASRLDALYKVICNSERGLDSKSINLEFTRKWLISGMNDANDVTKLPMSEAEKDNIRDKVKGGEDVFPVKTPVDIKRFTDNMANLKLDDAYEADFYRIGSMYNIPRDILEAYNSKGTTYENQEKSIVRHIEYSLKPKGEELTDALEDILDIEDTTMTWEHLACYQVFESERQDVITKKLNNAILAKENNIDLATL